MITPNGVTYDGSADFGKGPIHYFTDATTGSTFVLREPVTLAAIEAAANATRERFGQTSVDVAPGFMPSRGGVLETILKQLP